MKSSDQQQGALHPRQFDVSVIVCAFTEQRWKDLVDSIESIRAQQPPIGEIILVIDFNPSLLARAISEFSDITVVGNAHEQGLSGARNTGVDRASGDVIGFIDDDATARPGWVTEISKWFEDESVLGVGGAASPVWPGERPRWFPPEFDWVVGCSYLGLPTSSAAIRNPIGCNMAFRRQDLLGTAGFTSGVGRVGSVPAGCEETELSIRLTARRPGSRIVYVPSAIVDHRVTMARTQLTYFMRRCWHEGRSKAQIRHLVGPSAALATERSYVASVLPRGVARGLAQYPDGWKRSAAILLGFTLTGLGYLTGLRRPTSNDAER